MIEYQSHAMMHELATELTKKALDTQIRRRVAVPHAWARLMSAATAAAAYVLGCFLLYALMEGGVAALAVLPVSVVSVLVGVVIGCWHDLNGQAQPQRAQRQRPRRHCAREQQFQTLIEQSADALALLRADGTIVYESPSVRGLLGYAVDELIGRNAFDLIHPDDVARATCLWTQLLQTPGARVIAQTRHRHKDGSWRWVEGIGQNLLAEPSVQALVVNFRDISERKCAELASQHRADEFAALYETTRDLAAQHDLPRLLQLIVARAMTLLGTACGAMYLYDAARGDLEPVIEVGAPPSGARIPLGQGITGRVAQTRQPLIVDAYHRWGGRLPQYAGVPLGAILEVPMLSRGELIGVLGVAEAGERRQFSEADARLLSLFASQAASAVHNAQLFAEVQRLAITDELTGVSNRRQLIALGEREFLRARRFGHPLCALMLDVDRFKQVNDSYGHALGDQVLRAVAACCLTETRDIDVVGRYGGDELALLLVEMAVGGACRFAERLRAAVAQSALPTSQGPVRVTISVGIACSGEAVNNLSALLEQADQALYRAKRAGRNRVVVEACDAEHHQA